MKKSCVFFLTILVLAGTTSLPVFSSVPSGNKTTMKPKVEVYYFHYSRRCATCIQVENETRRIVESVYADQIKKGEVVFGSINLEDAANKALADRCEATGQSILIVSDGKRQDITQQGFMLVRNPSRFEQEIKKSIDPILGIKR